MEPLGDAFGGVLRLVRVERRAAVGGGVGHRQLREEEREEVLRVGGALEPFVQLVGEQRAQPPPQPREARHHPVVHEGPPPVPEGVAVLLGHRRRPLHPRRRRRRGAHVREDEAAVHKLGEVEQVAVVPRRPRQLEEARLARDAAVVPRHAEAVAVDALVQLRVQALAPQLRLLDAEQVGDVAAAPALRNQRVFGQRQKVLELDRRADVEGEAAHGGGREGLEAGGERPHDGVELGTEAARWRRLSRHVHGRRRQASVQEYLACSLVRRF